MEGTIKDVKGQEHCTRCVALKSSRTCRFISSYVDYLCGPIDVLQLTGRGFFFLCSFKAMTLKSFCNSASGHYPDLCFFFPNSRRSRLLCYFWILSLCTTENQIPELIHSHLFSFSFSFFGVSKFVCLNCLHNFHPRTIVSKFFSFKVCGPLFLFF